MKKDPTIKFLPSYVGSKKYWISQLQQFKGEDFIEPFCGSAVLSANLAKTAILNDTDKYIYLILNNFDKLIVPETFTQKDYFRIRNNEEWWKYIYCLQKMSFSGVFRYSKNGYNVPVKPLVDNIKVRPDYEIALSRWKELKPLVLNQDYTKLTADYFKDRVVVFDPPYSESSVSYCKNSFDYTIYWDFVYNTLRVAKACIIFDKLSNLTSRQIPIVDTRKMRVNGQQKGNLEALAIFEKGQWRN
jgi:site-specific DNA-adenine methylase